MILSASRRTDIPAHYADWFLNRLRAGYVLARNPMNHAQVREIALSPEKIDCVVFWTKDPVPLLDYLSDIDAMGYTYYFQFTLTPYSKTLEHHLRDKSEIAETFIRLGKHIGRNRLVWRYDPIILNHDISIDYHIKHFMAYCEKLHPYTDEIVISFVDCYPKLRTNLIRAVTEEEILALGSRLSQIAGQFGLPVNACCESLDLLSTCGIGQASCIDKTRIEALCGHSIAAAGDKNQRADCRCVQSVDIGAYNTCQNGCVYCYANYSESSVAANCRRHDPQGEFLISYNPI